MINNKEIVPLLPFNILFPSYENVGDKFFKYNTGGKCEIINHITNNIFESYSINDHLLKNMITNIYKNIIVHDDK
jgi:hypothetical protein